ncbi:hypothetical protein GGF42_004445 [Coemansia sp. RSA 2424]|nr:hypothetical protein GGF42_004445 [Coemansia sp. RSA 2424]
MERYVKPFYYINYKVHIFYIFYIGQNFAVASLGFTGSADHVTLVQILGGNTGTQIEALERDLRIDYRTVRTAQQTRTCTTCIDARSITELVGTSDAIDPEAAAEFEVLALDLLHSSASSPPRALALCGTFPPGLGSDAVARIISAAAKSTNDKPLVFVDAVKDIGLVLATKCIDVLKINSAEAVSLASACDPLLDTREARAAATYLANRFSIGIVAVTDGPGAAYLADSSDGTCYELHVPDLLEDCEYFLGGGTRTCDMLNPIGAGDTCSAVMVNSLLDGMAAVDAFALGLAAASASCFVLMPNCVFDLDVMQRIRGKIAITKLVT